MSSPLTSDVPRIDLSKPRYPQDSYLGRLKHFLSVTDVTNIFHTKKQLERAKKLLHQYKRNEEPVQTTVDDIWHAKKLYESAYHPDTGELNLMLGRMSFQIPGNMAVGMIMLTWYQTTPAILVTQTINQSFMAVVNYVNRNASVPVDKKKLGGAFLAATGGAVAAGIGINRLAVGMHPLVGRLVPFAAVATANAINIPIMRSTELTGGIVVETEDGIQIGKSKQAARSAITKVVLSRVVLAAPALVMTPVVMQGFSSTLRGRPIAAQMVQMTSLAVGLAVGVPMACALFAQRASMPVKKLERELREKMQTEHPHEKYVWFNKGL